MDHRTRSLLSAALCLATGSASSLAQTPVDTAWTYQGRLTDAGAEASGQYDFRFTLFLDDQGTLQNGGALDMPGIQVDSGLFTTKLDFGALFSGYKNWLLVEVSAAGAGDYTALPLQEITSVPQALMSQTSQSSQTLVLPYAGSADVPAPGAVVHLYNADPTDGYTMLCDTDANNGIAVFGSANATSGFAYGGYFQSAATDGRAVFGLATATSGLALGGRFVTQSDTGRGIFSTANSPTGANYGLWGDSFSTSGTGVYGIALAGSGFTFGGNFECNSPDGRGVRAIANSTTGLAVGGRFASASNAGIGVWSTASATSGVNYGVFGDSFSASGYGGYFHNTAAGGTALWADGLAKVKTLQILGGSDLAEPFDVHGAPGAQAAAEVLPGMVVIIDADHPGDLRLSDQAYDTSVAGVVSGANGLQPGMVMKAQGQDKADGAQPVAMTGRVWCYVDASFGAVKPGDRLTTSSTPGHAMLAADGARCGGTVIGKAMTALPEGKGLVLVLVNLQ